MKDDISDIQAMYDRAVEAEHSRLERHQLEHDLTWRYLERYLPPSGSILEIGAATGRYTVGLCQRGYSVTAVDLSSGLLGACRVQLAEAGLEQQARLVVADARDLRSVEDKDFDAVLLMGPLYHLIEEEDRIEALRQATGKLRSGGILFSAFISRLGFLADMMSKHPEWIENRDEVRSILDMGSNPGNPRTGGFRGYFARVSEIAPLHEGLGIRTLALAGAEPSIAANDEIYNSLEGTQRELWLDLLFEISVDESITGASRHLLYVGQKW